MSRLSLEFNRQIDPKDVSCCACEMLEDCIRPAKCAFRAMGERVHFDSSSTVDFQMLLIIRDI